MRTGSRVKNKGVDRGTGAGTRTANGNEADDERRRGSIDRRKRKKKKAGTTSMREKKKSQKKEGAMTSLEPKQPNQGKCVQVAGALAPAPPREREMAGHRMVGRLVRGLDEGKAYYGNIERVTKVDGKMRYHVAWHGGIYVDESYSFAQISSLVVGVKEAEELGKEECIDEATPIVVRLESVCRAVEPSRRVNGNDQMIVNLNKAEDSYHRDDRGVIVLTQKGRRDRGFPDALTVDIRGRRSQGGSESDCDEDEASVGGGGEDSGRSWGNRAVSILSSSLKKGTKSSYRTAMRAWEQYLATECFDIGRLNWDPVSDNFVNKSIEAEKLFMGFIAFCVEERGTTVDTAVGYKTSVKGQINSVSGLDMTYGLEWQRLKRLVARLKRLYPHKKKPRLPVLQQHLRAVFEIIELIRQGFDASEIKEEKRSSIRLETESLNALIRVVRKNGALMCRAVLSTMFLSVSRAGDCLPDTQMDFDEEVDSTISDVCWTDYGFALKFKETKTGFNPEFEAKPLVEDVGNVLCPATAMSAYLEEYKEREFFQEGQEGKLPLFVDASGAVLTTNCLRELVKASVGALGEDPSLYGAHSLRIGGATAAIAAPSGSELTCKVLGYWLSSAVRVYTKPTEGQMVQLVLEMMRSKQTKVARV